MGMAARDQQICGWSKELKDSSSKMGWGNGGYAVIIFMMIREGSKTSQPAYMLDRVTFENAHKIHGCPKTCCRFSIRLCILVADWQAATETGFSQRWQKNDCKSSLPQQASLLGAKLKS
jgi:hypothetical protein